MVCRMSINLSSNSPYMAGLKGRQWDVLALCVHFTGVAGVKSVCAVEWKEGNIRETSSEMTGRQPAVFKYEQDSNLWTWGSIQNIRVSNREGRKQVCFVSSFDFFSNFLHSFLSSFCFVSSIAPISFPLSFHPFYFSFVLSSILHIFLPFLTTVPSMFLPSHESKKREGVKEKRKNGRKKQAKKKEKRKEGRKEKK